MKRTENKLNTRSLINLLEVVPSGDVTHIEVALIYKKGGVDKFSGVDYARGVYLSVEPVRRSDGLSLLGGFGGELMLVKRIDRLTSRCFDDVEVDFLMMNKLINFVVGKNGLELKPQSSEYLDFLTEQAQELGVGY